MAVAINIKAPCNKIDSPSNKGNTSSVHVDDKKIAYIYKDMNITVLKPIMDKLTFGFTPTEGFLNQYDPSQNLDEYKEHIQKSTWFDAKMSNKDSGLTLLTGVPFKKPPYVHYKLNALYKPPSSKETIFVQIGPKNEGSNRAFIKFDLNPSKFNKMALSEFRAFVEELFLLPSATVTYNQIIARSSIYRVHIAVDILGARPSDLEIQCLKGQKISPSKSHEYKSKTGRTETIYPKVKKGNSSTEVFYDKRQERIDSGKVPLYGDGLHTRFECTALNTDFQKLPHIHNRCLRYSVRALNLPKYAKMHHVLKLFIRHALLKTLDSALAIIPAKYQPKFEQAYLESVKNIWDPANIWSHWKDTVEESGLYFTHKKVHLSAKTSG